VPTGTCLQAIGMLTLEPERLTLMRPQPEWKIVGDGPGATSRRSSGLQFQFFWIEVFSFFPNG
jgi:hypothetical protein